MFERMRNRYKNSRELVAEQQVKVRHREPEQAQEKTTYYYNAYAQEELHKLYGKHSKIPEPYADNNMYLGYGACPVKSEPMKKVLFWKNLSYVFLVIFSFVALGSLVDFIKDIVAIFKFILPQAVEKPIIDSVHGYLVNNLALHFFLLTFSSLLIIFLYQFLYWLVYKYYAEWFNYDHNCDLYVNDFKLVYHGKSYRQRAYNFYHFDNKVATLLGAISFALAFVFVFMLRVNSDVLITNSGWLIGAVIIGMILPQLIHGLFEIEVLNLTGVEWWMDEGKLK